MGKYRTRRPTRPKLVKARERLGMTRPQLAAKLGLARSYVYKIEIGDINPGVATIVEWLKALGPEASIDLFEPHPALKKWTDVVGQKVRRKIAQQLVA
jgi:transcriptional regulator with XRE-family HTH domain